MVPKAVQFTAKLSVLFPNNFPTFPREISILIGAICNHIVGFWKDVIDWFNEHDIKVDSLSKADIVFGDWERKNDFLLFNHILLTAKKYI